MYANRRSRPQQTIANNRSIIMYYRTIIIQAKLTTNLHCCFWSCEVLAVHKCATLPGLETSCKKSGCKNRLRYIRARALQDTNTTTVSIKCFLLPCMPKPTSPQAAAGWLYKWDPRAFEMPIGTVDWPVGYGSENRAWGANSTTTRSTSIQPRTSPPES